MTKPQTETYVVIVDAAWIGGNHYKKGARVELSAAQAAYLLISRTIKKRSELMASPPQTKDNQAEGT